MGKGDLLNDAARDLLLRPERWRLVSSLFPAETDPVRNVAHNRWMRGHSHAHPHGEVLFVLDGRGHHGFGEGIYPLTPGTVLLFSPMYPHDIGYRSSAGPSRHLWMSLLPDHVFVNLVRHRRSRRPAYASLWHHMLRRSDIGFDVRTLTAPPDVNEPVDVRRARVTGALSMLTAAVVSAARGANAAGRDRSLQADVVRAIEQHMRETAGRGVTLESVARLAGYNKYHFHRVFKSHVGMTLHQYVDMCRQDRMHELSARGLSKRAISEALGFSHPAAFSRWERRIG